MCGIGVHSWMPHRRNHNLRRANWKIEALKPLREGIFVRWTIAKTRPRHERDQIGVTRDPHGIGESWHDNRRLPSEPKFIERLVNRSGELAFP